MITVHTKNLNQAVLITGCSSGIGQAAALHLARRGFTVFATVRKAADADRLRALSEPNLIPFFPLDLTHREHIPPLMETVKDELSRRGLDGLYALINNAGGGGVAPIELMDLDAFQAEVSARLVGAAALVQACLPLLRQGKGRLLWIMTPAAIPTPYVASIHACDFAVNGLARTLDIELKPWDIPSIQVRCGGIKTERGLQTTSEVEAILSHPDADLYRDVLTRWSRDMSAFDAKRTPPERVAETIEKALLAKHPRRRYAVGFMTGPAALLESLPQPLVDAILRFRF